MTVGTRIAIRSRLPKHFKILTGGSRRTAAGWTMGTLRQLKPSALWESHLLEFQLIVLRGKRNRSHRLQAERKETCSLTPRGGFFDGRNQNRDPEPSAKTFQDSDRREPPNSRGMDHGDSKTTETFGSLGIPLTGIPTYCASGQKKQKPPASSGTQRNLFTDSPRWIL